jgi:arylsulfatase A-like enzyme
MMRTLGAAILLAAGVAVGCGGSAKHEGGGERPVPNVLLVVLDTTRADALSCYGSETSSTPRIDEIAAEGTVFRRAFATSFWTLPSHGSLLTGRYPSEAGATSETNHLPDAAVTLAERLAAAGYRTAAVVRNPWLASERGFAQGFDHFVEAWRGDAPGADLEGERRAVEEAVRWLDDGRRGADPFMLFVNLNIAHLPYTPAEEVFARFASRDWPAARVERLRTVTGGWEHLVGTLHLDETDYAILRELYAAEVHQADGLVGRLIDGLRRRGVLDRTIVIITSDHGENLGDHGMIDHVYSLYDTTVRVPLIIRYPARVAAGTEVDELVSLVDVVPTVLDACGVAGGGERDSLPGTSLCSLRGEQRDTVFAENGRPLNGVRLLRRWFPDFDVARIDHPMRMIRTERYKLIWKVGVAAELYDLDADPAETTDLGRTDRAASDRLLVDLRTWVAGLDVATVPRRFTSRDEEGVERLRALGYVE